MWLLSLEATAASTERLFQMSYINWPDV